MSRALRPVSNGCFCGKEAAVEGAFAYIGLPGGLSRDSSGWEELPSRQPAEIDPLDCQQIKEPLLTTDIPTVSIGSSRGSSTRANVSRYLIIIVFIDAQLLLFI